MRNILLWIDDRTGISTAVRRCADRQEPGGPCWCKCWPSAIAFAFCVQLITGFFLWMYYSPGAQSAWESVYFLQHEVIGGWLLRAIHHWSAQVLLVMIGLYLLQIILTGVYRAPRELVFWTVVLMGLVTLGLHLTGDLLAWDRTSVSSTQVRVNFLNLLPGIGSELRKVATGGPDFGSLTLTRFLALHAGLLTAGMAVLIVLHEVFKHRVDTVESDRGAKSCPHWPRQALRDAIACLVVMAAVLLLALLPSLVGDGPGVELGSPGDPTNSYTAARPEWAFLGLYRFAGLFPDWLKLLPIFVVPGLLVGVVLAMPWIARGKKGHWFNVAFTVVLLAGTAVLSFQVVAKDRKNPDHQAAVAEEHELAGRAVELARGQGIPAGGALTLLRGDPRTQGPKLCQRLCGSCHNYTPPDGYDAEQSITSETRSAPELYGFAGRQWLEGFMDPTKIGTPKYYGSTRFAAGLMVRYVQGQFSKLKQPQREAIIAALSAEAGLQSQQQLDRKDRELIAQGRELLSSNECTRCHRYRGNGPADVAPDLTGYGSREWIVGIIGDPAHPMLYGKRNDRMMAYFELPDKPAENLLTARDVGLLTDWLRGEWYRHEPGPIDPEEAEPEAAAAVRPTVENLAGRWHSRTSQVVAQPATGPHSKARDLFRQEHCSICHDFTGTEGEDIVAIDPSAPDLGNYASRQWLTGLLDVEGFKTRKYFGNSKFRRGDMANFLGELLPDFDDEDKQDFAKLVIALSAEAQLPAQREMDQRDAELIEEGKELLVDFGCTDCHRFGEHKASDAPNLTGYGSAEWLQDIISDPAAKRFYGKDNEGMPSYHAFAQQPGRNLLTPEQVKSLAELIRGEKGSP